jgi:hypothetical protein
MKAICPSCGCQVDVRNRWQWELDAGKPDGETVVHHMQPGTIRYNPDGVSLAFSGIKCPGSDSPAAVRQ